MLTDAGDAPPHIFRHTYITMAASSGIDVKTLQEIAGHSDIKMTMERYAHAREEKVMQAGAMSGNVFKAVCAKAMREKTLAAQGKNGILRTGFVP